MRQLRVCSSLLLSRGRLASIGTLLVLFASCGKSVRTTPAMPLTQGVVHGGQQPVSGANIALYAAGSSGYGSSSTNTSILTSTVTSGSDGSFSITGLYTCPSGSQQMYLVATGGDSGAGTNSSLALMAALGPCSALTSSTFVFIDEVTTVAAVYALAPFMATNSGSPGANLGASSSNSTGLANAFITASNLANTVTGSPPGSALPSGATAPSNELNTLADILATCVNSDGSSGECSTLFADATPSGGGVPTNTLDAILDIAQNPSNNVSALYSLVTGTPPFQPTLGQAPNDWLVAMNYTGGGLDGPNSLVVDSSGNVWVVNTTGNSLTKFSNSGTVLTGSSGYTGGGLSSPRFAAIDISGNIWLTNANNSISEFSSSGGAESGSLGDTGGGLNSPQGIALATGASTYMANNGANTLSKFTGGVPKINSPYSGGGLSAPFGIAISNGNIAWISNSNNSLSEFMAGNGTALSGASGFTGGGLNSPKGIAIDHSGNIWLANNGGASLSEFNSGGTAISTSAGYTGGGLVDPYQIAIDGLNDVWVTNPTGDCVSEFSDIGTAISGSSGYTGGGLSSPQGIAIDGSGNVWVADSSTNKVTEIVGAAAPVVTPLITAVVNNQLGARP
jgi:hypothetical protein